MAAKVTFDGVAKLISIEDGITTIDVKSDLYSAWKDWVLEGNANFPPAFSTVGGDPLGGGRQAGTYFFLNNIGGWRIKPQEASHALTIIGNAYALDPDREMFKPTDGAYTVSIRLETSSLTQAIEVFGSAGTIANAVWGASASDVSTREGSIGMHIVKKLMTLLEWRTR